MNRLRRLWCFLYGHALVSTGFLWIDEQIVPEVMCTRCGAHP